MDEDEQEEGRETGESITEELRDCIFDCPHLKGVADRVDARFDRELTAKQEEVDGLKADMSDLQARLDASIPLPVDADGKAWTGDDVDKSFSLTDGDKATSGLVREIAYGCPREGWWLVDQYDTHYPADKCRHVATEPPKSIEDVRKSCDNTIAYLASVSGMGWHDVETFSKDVHKQLDRAYACGKRDVAGEQA